MANISRVERSQASRSIISLQVVATLAALVAVANVVIQIAANVGLFAIPSLLKPIFFTTALAIGSLTISHFALAAAGLAFLCFVIGILKKSLPATTPSVPAPSVPAPSAPALSAPSPATTPSAPATTALTSNHSVTRATTSLNAVAASAPTLPQPAINVRASASAAVAASTVMRTPLATQTRPQIGSIRDQFPYLSPVSSTEGKNRQTDVRKNYEAGESLCSKIFTGGSSNTAAALAKLQDQPDAKYFPVTFLARFLLEPNESNLALEARMRSEIFGLPTDFDLDAFFEFKPLYRSFLRVQTKVICELLRKKDESLVQFTRDLSDHLAKLVRADETFGNGMRNSHVKMAILAKFGEDHKAKIAEILKSQEFKDQCRKELVANLVTFKQRISNLDRDVAPKKLETLAARLARRAEGVELPVVAVKEGLFGRRVSLEEAVQRSSEWRTENVLGGRVIDLYTPNEEAGCFKHSVLACSGVIESGDFLSFQEQLPEKASFGELSAAIVHAKGVFRETDQDAHMMANLRLDNGEEVAAFAIFDGHGGDSKDDMGKHIADRLAKQAPQVFQNRLQQLLDHRNRSLKDLRDEEIEAACILACEDLNNELWYQDGTNQAGSTMTLTLHINGYIWCVNVGDARTTVIHDNGEVEQLSQDAHPANDIFKKSILKRHGNVDVTSTPPRMTGEGVELRLTTARSLGDHILMGNTSRPKVTKTEAKDVKAIVLSCDGPYEVFTNQQIGGYVARNLGVLPIETIAAKVVRGSLVAGSKDNCCAMVVMCGNHSAAAAAAE